MGRGIDAKGSLRVREARRALRSKAVARAFGAKRRSRNHFSRTVVERVGLVLVSLVCSPGDDEAERCLRSRGRRPQAIHLLSERSLACSSVLVACWLSVCVVPGVAVC